MSVIEQYKLIKTDVDENNNKFWEGILYENNDVFCRWGRVGNKGQSKTFLGKGKKYLDKKLKEKARKGYQPAKILNGSSTTVLAGNLKEVAKKQIEYSCPTVGKLIDYLAQVNRHQITTASGGKINVDLNTGLIKTPLGVVTEEAISNARSKLDTLSDCIQKKDWESQNFKTAINEYMMLVPQKVSIKRDWPKRLLPNTPAVQKQNALLDSLEATLKHVLQNPNNEEEKVFSVKLTKTDKSSTKKKVNNMVEKTRKGYHSCSHLRVHTIYEVDIESMRAAFDNDGAKLSNVWELWHGTQASNLLSILKGGLIIPPSRASHVTGRMYGNGIYFSDQSTKSLNYAYGYWHGGSRSNRCFMFLTDVAMGKYHTPSSPNSGPPKGYDSTFAKAGQSGVMNNEMIVYRCSQANLKYLVEFKG